jgi:DNA repair protein RadC
LIFIHNHPSGDLNPSQEDKQITAKLKNGLSFFDIPLMDHLIVNNTGYYSFLEMGELNNL